MLRARIAEIPSHAADATHFVGDVVRQDIASVQDPASSAVLVEFLPGGRTNWHRHPGGQYLYVVAGSGWIQAHGAEPIEIREGDCIYTAPDEEHWHGADTAVGMSHLAFSFGATVWGAPVDS